MSEAKKAEDVRRALVRGCRGSDRDDVVVRRSDVETVLGAKAESFLAKFGSGSTISLVSVNRKRLLVSLERKTADETPSA